MTIKSVCVYCASSSKVDQVYFDDAQRLGNLLAENDITCVCGGGHQGLMKTLADAVIDSNGLVKGIIPRFMYDEGWHHTNLSELVLTESIHERKELMATCADAAIAMPGGCGTMEELLEIITWKQLGLYFNPVIILNTNNYYDPLLAMLDKAVKETFMANEHKSIWQTAKTPDEAIYLLHNANKWYDNPRDFAAI